LIKLGLYKIASTLKFLTQDCNLVHGNVNINSIFVIKSGEWKLAGYELVSSASDEPPVLLNLGYLLPNRYIPPEMEKSNSIPYFLD
jgi:SCY1-like protein 1